FSSRPPQRLTPFTAVNDPLDHARFLRSHFTGSTSHRGDLHVEADLAHRRPRPYRSRDRPGGWRWRCEATDTARRSALSNPDRCHYRESAVLARRAQEVADRKSCEAHGYLVVLKHGDLQRVVTAPPYKATRGESLMGLAPGERTSVTSLLEGLLVPSG